MFLTNQPEETRSAYIQMLRSTSSLSSLFSESSSPFLVSRNVENAFCQALGAKNLGRSDCSADALKDRIGIGIKTFLHGNGKTLQKVAEFNKDSDLYRGKSPKELINTIVILRNERIQFTKRTYSIDKMIYHCVTRKPGKVLIFEELMDLIQISSITKLKVSNNRNTITFEDGLHEYSFNVTKSTLYKRFILVDPIEEINVKIINNPYRELAKLFEVKTASIQQSIFNSKHFEDFEKVILPLYSDRGNKRHVPEKSGLNQWNAAGRPRNSNEIYIPIPKWIHRKFPSFFPDRDHSFELSLPNSNVISAKVCQDDKKALMSNPNSALGEWLLRQVINLEERELLTYEMLERLNIDSVVVYKHNINYFSIDFCSLGSFDEFESEHSN